jgi:hypothetical protein
MNINDVKEFVTLPNGLVTVVAKPCEVPPEGWACSRDRGHKGPCAATSGAIVERCELGEHCRCKSFDAAYKADCWNWIGEVKL